MWYLVLLNRLGLQFALLVSLLGIGLALQPFYASSISTASRIPRISLSSTVPYNGIGSHEIKQHLLTPNLGNLQQADREVVLFVLNYSAGSSNNLLDLQKAIKTIAVKFPVWNLSESFREAILQRIENVILGFEIKSSQYSDRNISPLSSIACDMLWATGKLGFSASSHSLMVAYLIKELTVSIETRQLTSHRQMCAALSGLNKLGVTTKTESGIFSDHQRALLMQCVFKIVKRSNSAVSPSSSKKRYRVSANILDPWGAATLIYSLGLLGYDRKTLELAVSDESGSLFTSLSSLLCRLLPLMSAQGLWATLYGLGHMRDLKWSSLPSNLRSALSTEVARQLPTMNPQNLAQVLHALGVLLGLHCDASSVLNSQDQDEDQVLHLQGTPTLMQLRIAVLSAFENNALRMNAVSLSAAMTGLAGLRLGFYDLREEAQQMLDTALIRHLRTPHQVFQSDTSWPSEIMLSSSTAKPRRSTLASLVHALSQLQLSWADLSPTVQDVILQAIFRHLRLLVDLPVARPKKAVWRPRSVTAKVTVIDIEQHREVLKGLAHIMYALHSMHVYHLENSEDFLDDSDEEYEHESDVMELTSGGRCLDASLEKDLHAALHHLLPAEISFPSKISKDPSNLGKNVHNPVSSDEVGGATVLRREDAISLLFSLGKLKVTLPTVPRGKLKRGTREGRALQFEDKETYDRRQETVRRILMQLASHVHHLTAGELAGVWYSLGLLRVPISLLDAIKVSSSNCSQAFAHETDKSRIHWDGTEFTLKDKLLCQLEDVLSSNSFSETTFEQIMCNAVFGLSSVGFHYRNLPMSLQMALSRAVDALMKEYNDSETKEIKHSSCERIKVTPFGLTLLLRGLSRLRYSSQNAFNASSPVLPISTTALMTPQSLRDLVARNIGWRRLSKMQKLTLCHALRPMSNASTSYANGPSTFSTEEIAGLMQSLAVLTFDCDYSSSYRALLNTEKTTESTKTAAEIDGEAFEDTMLRYYIHSRLLTIYRDAFLSTPSEPSDSKSSSSSAASPRSHESTALSGSLSSTVVMTQLLTYILSLHMHAGLRDLAEEVLRGKLDPCNTNASPSTSLPRLLDLFFPRHCQLVVNDCDSLPAPATPSALHNSVHRALERLLMTDTSSAADSSSATVSSASTEVEYYYSIRNEYSGLLPSLSSSDPWSNAATTTSTRQFAEHVMARMLPVDLAVFRHPSPRYRTPASDFDAERDAAAVQRRHRKMGADDEEGQLALLVEVDGPAHLLATPFASMLSADLPESAARRGQTARNRGSRRSDLLKEALYLHHHRHYRRSDHFDLQYVRVTASQVHRRGARNVALRIANLLRHPADSQQTANTEDAFKPSRL